MVEDRDLLDAVARLNKISSQLISDWPNIDRVAVRDVILQLEREISQGRLGAKPSFASKQLFSDKTVFPSRESLAAYIESEFGIHVSPDWQRSRLEQEAARLAAGRTINAIREAAVRLAKANWIVRKASKTNRWKELFGKNEQQIRTELNDPVRFPSVDSLKEYATGLLSYDEMKSITKRDTLADKIVNEVMRHAGVSRLGD